MKKRINVLILCLYDAAGIPSKLNFFLNYYPQYFKSDILYYSSHGYQYNLYNSIDDINIDIIKKKIEWADAFLFELVGLDHPAYRLYDLDFKRELHGKKVFFYSLCSPYIWDIDATLDFIVKHNVYVIPAFYEETRHYNNAVKQVYLPYPILNKELLYYKNRDGKESRSIKLFHSPTNEMLKNSHIFLKTAIELRKRHPNIELIYNRGLTYRENMRSLSSADIVYDEMWVMSLWGQSGIEATALGKPVLVYLSEESQIYWQKVCGTNVLPFVLCEPQNLKRKLIELIESEELRKYYGERSKHWFWEHWSGEKTARRYYNAICEMEPFKK
ncbi:MAG: hypothetical protein AB1765_00860 [Candidatus Hydrogenedentota bacterium]